MPGCVPASCATHSTNSSAVPRADRTVSREQWTTSQHGSLRFVSAPATRCGGRRTTRRGRPARLRLARCRFHGGVVGRPRRGLERRRLHRTRAGARWLSRCDDRVTGGWRTAGQGGARLGWLWSSGRMANRPKPFIRAVTIDESSLRVVAEPDVWSPTIAWAYPAAGSSRRGRVGLSAFFGSATSTRRTSSASSPTTARRGRRSAPRRPRTARCRASGATTSRSNRTRGDRPHSSQRVHPAGRPGPAQRRTADVVVFGP